MIDLKKNHERDTRRAKVAPVNKNQLEQAERKNEQLEQEIIDNLGTTKANYNFDGLDTIFAHYETIYAELRQKNMHDLEQQLNAIDVKRYHADKAIINIKEAGSKLTKGKFEDIVIDLANSMPEPQAKVYSEDQDGIAFIFFPVTYGQENQSKFFPYLTKRDFDLKDDSALIKRTIASLKKKILSLEASLDNTAHEYDQYIKQTAWLDKLLHPVIHTHNKQFYNAQMKDLYNQIKATEKTLNMYRKTRSLIKAIPEEVRALYIDLLNAGEQKTTLIRQYSKLDSEWQKYSDNKCPELLPFDTFINEYLAHYMDKSTAIKIVKPFYDYMKENNFTTTLGGDKYGFSLAAYVNLNPYKNAAIALLNRDIFEKIKADKNLDAISPAHSVYDDDDDDDFVNICYGKI